MSDIIYVIHNQKDMVNIMGWDWCICAKKYLPWGEKEKVLEEGEPRPEYPKNIGFIHDRDIVSGITRCIEIIRAHDPEFSMDSIRIHKQ